MDESNVEALLREIRDLQREHLEEYRKYVQRAMDLQQLAVNRQEEHVRLYRRVVFGGGGLLLAAFLLFALLVSIV